MIRPQNIDTWLDDCLRLGIYRDVWFIVRSYHLEIRQDVVKRKTLFWCLFGGLRCLRAFAVMID